MSNQMTVLVTGATAGFGAAIARRFVGEGHKVIATGRRTERLDALKAELGDALLPLAMDVREFDAVVGAVSALPDDFAAVDVLVNNAGLALGLEAADKANMADWQTMIDTNVNGVVYCTRALLPGMVERGKGHVINLGSVAGAYPYPGGNVYGATKAFVHQFSLNLRADLLGKNIRVTSVEPGAAETEFSLVRFKGDDDKAATVYKGFHPMSPEDIADTVFYVANLPSHVNINRVEMMPTQQAFSPFAFNRDG